MTEHGTYAGYNAHFTPSGRFYGEPVDRACQDAANLACRRRRAKRYMAQSDLYVDATGTKRRLQALHRIGWTFDALGRLLTPDSKHPTQVVWHLLARQKRVHLRTKLRVEEIYEELSVTPGPDLRSQRRAIRNGWAPPAAWDDIDDPEAKPQGMTKKEIAA